jgi:hypothetical protein
MPGQRFPGLSKRHRTVTGSKKSDPRPACAFCGLPWRERGARATLTLLRGRRGPQINVGAKSTLPGGVRIFVVQRFLERTREQNPCGGRRNVLDRQAHGRDAGRCQFKPCERSWYPTTDTSRGHSRRSARKACNAPSVNSALPKMIFFHAVLWFQGKYLLAVTV